MQEAGTSHCIVERTYNVPTIHHNVPIYQTSYPQVRRYDVGAPSGITISLPGAESQDAERRRQIALRALSGQNISPQDANAIIEPTESLKGLFQSKLSPLEGRTLVHNKLSPLEGGTLVHNKLSPLHQSQTPTACAWRQLVLVLV